MTQALTAGQDFANEFNAPSNKVQIQQFLKEEKQLKTFTAVVFRAVKENPDLLLADRTSMFLACQRAAEDGLMPNNREGALVVYNTNKGTRDKPEWVKTVQWQPMIQGLRRILARHNFSMEAEIVYANDLFEYRKGDNSEIVHQPPPLGQSRGKMIGAYAIATDKNTGEKYREVMDMPALDAVRNTSKNANGGAWKSFPDEMHRKTPAKRLMKYLPLIETDIFDLIDRDNEQFEMNKPTGPSRAAQEVQEAVRASQTAPIEGEVVAKDTKKELSPEEDATKATPAEEIDPLGF